MGKVLGVLLVVALLLGGCVMSSYNGIVSLDETVNSQWSEVQNQYKRRFDLIPQLVETVKGAADFEKSTITEVTELRASVGKLTLPEGAKVDQAQLDEFMKAQDALGKGLSRLLVVAENYPQLKASQNFLSLQDQIEGTENRIGTARRDYIDAVQRFNTKVRAFPGNLIAGQFGFEKRAQMTFEAGVDQRPTIDFGGNK